MENNYYGIYVVLASLPIWATITIFYLLTLFMVDAGREYFEGFSYNVSHAARYGDVGLLVIIIIGATILQRRPELNEFIATKTWLNISWSFLGILFLIMIIIEAELDKKGVKRQVVDIYHNIIIFPFVAYLMFSLIPVIYFHGTLAEKGVTEFFVITFFALLLYDIKDGRLMQHSWLKAHGYDCILKK